MPVIVIGKRARRVGLNPKTDLQKNEAENRRFERFTERLDDERRRSLCKIQTELLKAKQYFRERSSWHLHETPIDQKNEPQARILDLLESESSGFVPGMMYHSNGNIRRKGHRVASVGKAHDTFIKQLRTSQEVYGGIYRNTLPKELFKPLKVNKEGSESAMKVQTIQTPHNSFSRLARSRRGSTSDQAVCACRGNSNEVYRPDCKLCIRMVKDKMDALSKAQQILMGDQDRKSSEVHMPSRLSTWRPVPRGSWYSKQQSFYDAKRWAGSLPPSCSQETRNLASNLQRATLDNLLLNEPEIANLIGQEVMLIGSPGSAARRRSTRSRMGSIDNSEVTKQPKKECRESSAADVTERRSSINQITSKLEKQPRRHTVEGVIAEESSFTGQFSREWLRDSGSRPFSKTAVSFETPSGKRPILGVNSSNQAPGHTTRPSSANPPLKPWQKKQILKASAYSEQKAVQSRVSVFLRDLEESAKSGTSLFETARTVKAAYQPIGLQSTPSNVLHDWTAAR